MADEKKEWLLENLSKTNKRFNEFSHAMLPEIISLGIDYRICPFSKNIIVICR